MKSLWTKWMALLFVLSLLVSCGGGGGGGGGGTGDTMTITIGTNAPITYNGNASDPILTAKVITTKTYINLASGYSFATSSWAKILNITINATTSGTYTFSSAADPTGILYSDVPNTYQGTSGTITITIGDVGSPITGTFNATLLCGTGCTGTITMSGSFSVTRSQ